MKNQFFCWTIFACICMLSFSCSDDEMGMEVEEVVDEKAVELAAVVSDNFSPVKENPLDWTDEEMTFLDEWGDKKIIGLGESTHGTKEFFDAKFRILKYMAENHGFKIFAIEADFGESIFINEAIQAGDKEAIRSLMKDKMHFWTWRTEEVFGLITWMIDFNEGKSPEDKLQYVGVDCQYNTFHPDFVLEYLETNSQKLGDEAILILSDLKNLSLSQTGYENLTVAEFSEKLSSLDEIIEKYEAQKSNLVELTELKSYELNRRFLELCRQSFIVGVGRYIELPVGGDRDFYMAQNSLWYQDYLDGAKMVNWQHNYHVSRISTYGNSGSLGYGLDKVLGDDYKVVGFSFGKGGFTAVEKAGEFFLGLKSHYISTDPKSNSLNEYFYLTEEPAFAVKVADLKESDLNWDNLFIQGIDMLNIGSIYNNNPLDYYNPILGHYWDIYIHFQETTASEQLN